jgi:hypothetical protein
VVIGTSSLSTVANTVTVRRFADVDKVSSDTLAMSGPGVGPAAQDRHRIEVDLRAAGRPDDQVPDAPPACRG